MNCILQTAYWPNIHYFIYLLNAKKVTIEAFEHFEKQSYRNRTIILSANGPLPLSIPVAKHPQKTAMKDIHISYTENWQHQHWMAIVSAYNNSPYFEFLEDELIEFYNNRFETLLDYNMEQLKWLKKVFRLKCEIMISEAYLEKEEIEGMIDLRNAIHPKHESFDKSILSLIYTPYYQTFETKFGFTKNLSVLDLLFNTGIKFPNSYYL